MLEYSIQTLKRLEITFARKYKDFYVWARELFSRSITLYEENDKAEAILNETYETATETFGHVSLSTLLAWYLVVCEVLVEKTQLQRSGVFSLRQTF